MVNFGYLKVCFNHPILFPVTSETPPTVGFKLFDVYSDKKQMRFVGIFFCFMLFFLK